MNKPFLSISALAGLVLSSGVHATIFDFAAIAENGGEHGAPTLYFDISAAGIGEEVAGPSAYLTATATGGDPYLDAYSGALPGGLGVCGRVRSGGQCTPGNDDNITEGEAVRLAFASPVRMEGVEFHDENHMTAFAGDVGITVDGVLNTYALADFVDLKLDGSVFEFALAPGNTQDQFYVSNVDTRSIPVVAASTFGLAVFGLLAFARRFV